MHALQLLIQGSKFQESPCTSRRTRLEWLRVKWSECCRAPSMAHLHQSTVWIKLSIWQTIVDTVTSCATDEAMGWLCNFAAEVFTNLWTTDWRTRLSCCGQAFKWELLQMRTISNEKPLSLIPLLKNVNTLLRPQRESKHVRLSYLSSLLPKHGEWCQKICDQSGTEQLILCSMLQRNPVTD